MKRILLIDGDIVAYKYAAGSEHTFDWGDGVASTSANLEDAKANIDEHIAGLMSSLDADEYIVALSDPEENFRKDIYPHYKAHRSNNVQPIIRRELEAYLIERYSAKLKPRLEGDDVLGIIATNPKLYPKSQKIIVSDDKDMLTIPGTLFRGGALRTVSVDEADYYHMMQTLTGDRTDGYPGCPNVGPVKAERTLARLRQASPFKLTPWGLVTGVYEERGLTAADALVQARCARILRHEDYDYKRKEPRLWEPKK